MPVKKSTTEKTAREFAATALYPFTDKGNKRISDFIAQAEKGGTE